METRSGLPGWAPALAAALGLSGLIAWRYGPILLGLESSFADFDALHAGRQLTEAADSRLNAWILDWVQRSILSAPLGILDTNAFYPARGTLTGSEHLLGVAVQMLPFRPLLSGAVGLHQLALVLSAVGLAATSFLAVRGWTGSSTAGFAAGAAAVMMPWRLTEISHLQLASVQWFPLIWWLLVRAVYRSPGRAEQAVLVIAVALQLLSSFYLAYFLSFSCGLLLALIGFGDARRRARLPRIAACLAPGYALLGLTALPYLARQASDLRPGFDPALSFGLEHTFGLALPRLPGWLAGTSTPPLAPAAAFDLPAGVLVLALVAGVAALPGRSASRQSAWTPELRGAVVGLWAVALLGFVFALGGSIELFGRRVPLPSQLFAAVLPGFAMLRGPVRWWIVTSVAMPLLAGIGVAALERSRHGLARIATLALVLGGLAASLEWFPVPARAAWDDPDATQRRYAALSALPPGPVVEVPFAGPLQSIELGSRALLASTLHWRPLVNGYTGYPPPSHSLLQRLGARLPERDAILQLGRLTGVRYFVVDQRDLAPREIALWHRHDAEGLLTTRFADSTHRIYELRASAASGSAIDGLLAAKPGPTTAEGVPRTPLALAGDSAELVARIPPRQAAGTENPLSLRVANHSSVAWAGLDVHHEGLVLLRYTWREADSDLALETGVLNLDHDLAPGHAFSGQLWLRAPMREGPHDLCLDLVQQQDGQLIALGAPAVQQRVEIARRPGMHVLHGLRDEYAIRATEPAPCRPSRSGA